MNRVLFPALLLLAGCVNGSDSSSTPVEGHSASAKQDAIAPSAEQATRRVVIYVDGMT